MLRNRIYGLVMGGMATNTEASCDIDILLKSLHECRGFDPTDEVSRYQESGRVADPLVRTGAVALYYMEPGNYQQCLHIAVGACYATFPDDDMAEYCQFYSALLHGALNGLNKQYLLDSRYYPEHLKEMLQVPGSPPADCAPTVHKLIYYFYNSNSYHNGISRIKKERPADSQLLTIFGQLSGAYYGLADISEEAISAAPELDDEVSEILEGFCNEVSVDDLI